jgi:RNA polymerase sigma factor (sigma-70 family)
MSDRGRDVTDDDFLTERFEAHRPHLRGVAYRMLGSLPEAEDAVQEAWLRLRRADPVEVDNLGGWLTTVVARVCLDALRARKAKGEESLEARADVHAQRPADRIDPEEEAALADSVGLALLVVLETLPPPERLAFVLHDLFDVSFDTIARVVGRTEEATRQLASRGRRRVQGADGPPPPDRARQRRVVEAFLAAARGGDFAALLEVLDPDVLVRADPGVLPPGMPQVMRGPSVIAASAVKGRARAARAVLVDGAVGIVIAPHGRLRMVMRFTIEGDAVKEVDLVADPERLRRLTLAVLTD